MVASEPIAPAKAAPARGRLNAGQRKQRTDQRRQQIFTGALACFENKGFHETTLTDIAQASGVSTGLIYQYFSDKRDLLFQVILEILEAYNRDIPKALVGAVDPLERMQRAAIAYYKVINDRVSGTLFSYRESKSLDRDQLNTLKAKELQTNQLILDCLQACMDQGYIDPTDPELPTYWIVTSAHAWGLKNWRLRKLVSFEDYTRRTLGALLKGILNARGLEHLARCNLLDGRPLA